MFRGVAISVKGSGKSSSCESESLITDDDEDGHEDNDAVSGGAASALSTGKTLPDGAVTTLSSSFAAASLEVTRSLSLCFDVVVLMRVESTNDTSEAVVETSMGSESDSVRLAVRS